MSRPGPPGEALSVEVAGSGPPILLLHGFTGSSAGWSAIVSGLTGRHRVIIPDLLGHGRSDGPHTPVAYAPPRQASVLATLVVELDSEPATVVGYSMGARLALSLAVEHPRSVSALVVVSPSAGLADPTVRARRRDDDERWAKLLEEEGIAAFVDAWEAQPIFAGETGLPPAVRQRRRSERLAQDPRALAAALRGAGQGVMEPLHDRLASIDVPSLVIAGAADRVGLDRAREVAGLIPGARLEIVADSGHAPHLERPDVVLDLLDTFLGAAQPLTAS
jgi:2-succinyl-6-hydroxy-2,4-cyclohexadiene-1-carboxylate synthase